MTSTATYTRRSTRRATRRPTTTTRGSGPTRPWTRWAAAPCAPTRPRALTGVQDAAGRVTTYSYDGVGRLLSQTGPAGGRHPRPRPAADGLPVRHGGQPHAGGLDRRGGHRHPDPAAAGDQAVRRPERAGAVGRGGAGPRDRPDHQQCLRRLRQPGPAAGTQRRSDLPLLRPGRPAHGDPRCSPPPVRRRAPRSTASIRPATRPAARTSTGRSRPGRRTG